MPPLTCFSFGNYKTSLNNQNDKINKTKLKKTTLLELENNAKSKRTSINDYLNISLVINNNSFSGNVSNVIMDNDDTLNSNSSNILKNNISKKKGLSKEPNKKKNNLKLAQLYNIISRKDKNKKMK